MDTDELIKARRAEDIHAAGILGAKVVHFDFLDCIYRRDKNGDWTYTDVFIPPHEDDDGLPSQIVEAISARLNPDDELVCQLALGAHLDHTLVRRGVELLCRPLTYGVDIPYVFNFTEHYALKKAEMKENTQRMTEAVLRFFEIGAIMPYDFFYIRKFIKICVEMLYNSCNLLIIK